MILSINISKYFKILKQMSIKQTSIENIYEKCHMNVNIRNSRPFHICSLYFWIVKLFARNISFYIRCKLSFSITVKVLRVFFSTFTYVVRVTCLYATFAKWLFYSVCVKLYRLPMYMYVFTCLIETIQGTAVHFIHIRSIHFSQILEQITLNSSFFKE